MLLTRPAVHPAAYTTLTALARHLHHLHARHAGAAIAAALAGGLAANGLRHRTRQRHDTTRTVIAETAPRLKVKPDDITPQVERWHRNDLRHGEYRYPHGANDTDDTRLDLQADLTRKLGHPVNVAFNPPNRTVTVDAVPAKPPLPARIPHPGGTPPAGHIRLGVDTEGQTVTWPWNTSSPHALFCGPTRGGKTVAAVTAIHDAIALGADVTFLDPKREAGPRIRNTVHRFASNPDTITAAILDTQTELDRRCDLSDEAAANGRHDPPFQPLLLVIDEYVTLTRRLRNGQRGETPAEAALNAIVLMGGSLGFHVLLLTQRPDAKWVDGGLRDQLGCRVLIGYARRQTRTMMEIATELDDVTPGRAVAAIGPAEQVCQIFITPPATLAQLPQHSPNKPAEPPVASNSGRTKSVPAGQELASSVVQAAPQAVADPADTGDATGMQDEVAALVSEAERVVRTEPMTRQEVATRLGCSPQYVSQLTQAGRLHKTGKPGGPGLFDREEVERFAAGRVNRGEPPEPPAMVGMGR